LKPFLNGLTETSRENRIRDDGGGWGGSEGSSSGGGNLNIKKHKIMKTLISFAFVCIARLSFMRPLTRRIYSFHFGSLSSDSKISISQYQGKNCCLLVNMASESPYSAVQIPQMEQLYQQYDGSRVVIGFFLMILVYCPLACVL